MSDPLEKIKAIGAQKLESIKDPIEAIRWIINYNRQFAPLDLIELGRSLNDSFGGAKGLADKAVETFTTATNVTQQVTILKLIFDLFETIQKLQPPAQTEARLTDEQLEAAVKYITRTAVQNANPTNAESPAVGQPDDFGEAT